MVARGLETTHEASLFEAWWHARPGPIQTDGIHAGKGCHAIPKATEFQGPRQSIVLPSGLCLAACAPVKACAAGDARMSAIDRKRTSTRDWAGDPARKDRLAGRSGRSYIASAVSLLARDINTPRTTATRSNAGTSPIKCPVCPGLRIDS